MTEVNIQGPTDLSGTVRIQGSKNAAQKLIPSTVAFPGVYTLYNVPDIHDSRSQLEVLSFLGGIIDRRGSTIRIDTREIVSRPIPREISAKSTGTFLFAGALLSRVGYVRVFHPGGDDIGRRAVTWHLEAFRALGANIKTSADGYEVTGPRLKATEITFQRPTVNGTVNAILASVRCEGTTVLKNTPREPDIENTVELLNEAGAGIVLRHNAIEVHGSSSPTGSAVVNVRPDRNDAATFAIAGALLGGPITLYPIDPTDLAPLLRVFDELQVAYYLEDTNDGPVLTVERRRQLAPVAIESAAFPAFSTDWGPMMQVLMTQVKGFSTFHETIFADRFKHVEALVDMGANIQFFQPLVSPSTYNFDPSLEPKKSHAIRVVGPTRLHGRIVEATDVRAGAALVLAGLTADGQMTVRGYEHVQRGYERFVERLQQLGAVITSPRDGKSSFAN